MWSFLWDDPLWTTFNAARSGEYAEKVDGVRREHMPMLKWVAEPAATRIGRSRIVLLEKTTWESEALRLPCFQKLIDTPDAVMIDTFQWTRRSQCLLAEGRGHWTSFPCLHRMGHEQYTHQSRALSIACDGSHDHQRIEGSISQGLRSARKAEWPAPACRAILQAAVKEFEGRELNPARWIVSHDHCDEEAGA